MPTKIGDAVTLERPNSSRVVDGVALTLLVDSDELRADSPVRLALSVTNNTGRPIGYLGFRETRFAVVDQANDALWTDRTCRDGDDETLPATYVTLAPGEHVSLDDYYPTAPGAAATDCAAPAGHGYLTAGLTVCLNLERDGACRGASDERIQATPIAVTVS